MLAYYYKGCASWSWYYPFHYAPFASDLKDLEQYAPVMFDKSEPFSPHNANMAVLPREVATACQRNVDHLCKTLNHLS